MSPFDLAMEFVLRAEGGDSNDPDDRGGRTRYGISQRAYPRIDISTLTLEHARDLYHRDYWRPMRCDQLPSKVAVALFDYGVNCGVGAAVRELQRIIGVTVDGSVGPATIGATRCMDEDHVIRQLLHRRMSRYFGIVLGHPDQGKYLCGWANRLVDLASYVSGLK